VVVVDQFEVASLKNVAVPGVVGLVWGRCSLYAYCLEFMGPFVLQNAPI
jgi:hypothetical protein